MGLRDYEEGKDFLTKYHGYNPEVDTIQMKMQIATYLQWISSLHMESLLINRHCFKFSKLREEIFFIKCYVTGIDERHNDTTNTTEIKHRAGDACFLVTEESFWNRFLVFKSKNSNNNERFTKKDCSVSDLINMIILNDPSIGRVIVNLYPEEEDNVYAVFTSSPNKVLTSGFINKGVCKFTGCQHYNKRMWIALLQDPKGGTGNFEYRQTIQVQTPDGKTEEKVISFTVDSVSGYKTDKSSYMYYDPDTTDEKYTFALPLYNIQRY